jgi:hypothetical protein
MPKSCLIATKDDLELYRCTTLCAFFARVEDWDKCLVFYKKTFNLQRRFKIKRDEGLLDEQWEAFLAAKKILKTKGLI